MSTFRELFRDDLSEIPPSRDMPKPKPTPPKKDPYDDLRKRGIRVSEVTWGANGPVGSNPFAETSN